MLKYIHLIVVLISTFILGTLQAENIIKNPSFETTDGDLPASWQKMQLKSLKNNHSLSNVIASDGKISAVIENDNPELDVNAYMLYIQGISVAGLNTYPPNTDMELSVNVRSMPNTACKIRIYLEGNTSDSKNFGFISPPTEIIGEQWTRVKIAFKIPENKTFTSAHCCLQLLSTGKVFFDEVFLGPVKDAPIENLTAETNCIKNPSIESLDSNGKNPISWIPFQYNIEGNFQTVCSTNAKSGKYSLCINSGNQDVSDKNYVMWQQVGLGPALNKYPPKTPMKFSLWANNNSNPSIKFRFYIEMSSKGKITDNFISKPMTSYVGWQKFELNFVMPDTIPDSAYICLQLLTPGVVYFDDIFIGKADNDMVNSIKTPTENTYLRISDFPPQNTWIIPEKPQILTVDYQFRNAKENTFTATLKNTENKIIRTYELKGLPQKGIEKITIPELPEGVYFLTFSTEDIAMTDIFRIIPPMKKGIRFNDKNIAFLDDKAFFPLMVCTPDMLESSLKIYQQSGFNSIVFPGMTDDVKVAEYLSKTAHKYNLATAEWANLGDHCKNLNPEDTKKFLQKRINNAKNLKNFIGFMDDESEMRLLPLNKMTEIYYYMFEHAPEYAIWQNHAPRVTAQNGPYGTYANVKKFSRICDITGCDIYPVPEGGGHSDLANRTISCVGEYTDLISSTVFGKKPIWMILQASSWSEIDGGTFNGKSPRPDYHQLRFMCYNALTHGSTGLIFFGPGALSHNVKMNLPYMKIIADVLFEFKALEDFITLGEKKEFLSENKNIKIIEYNLNSETLIIAVNESKKTQDLILPSFMNRPFFLSPYAKEQKESKIVMAPNDVIILSTRKITLPLHDYFQNRTEKNDGSTMTEPADWHGQWVAHPEYTHAENTTTYAKHKIMLENEPVKAFIRIAADDIFELYINGKKVGRAWNHTIARQYDITSLLKKGENILAVTLINNTSLCGLVYEGEIKSAKGNISFFSGKDTMFSKDGKSNWTAPHLAGIPPVAPWGTINLILPE